MADGFALAEDVLLPKLQHPLHTEMSVPGLLAPTSFQSSSATAHQALVSPPQAQVLVQPLVRAQGLLLQEPLPRGLLSPGLVGSWC